MIIGRQVVSLKREVKGVLMPREAGKGAHIAASHQPYTGPMHCLLNVAISTDPDLNLLADARYTSPAHPQRCPSPVF